MAGIPRDPLPDSTLGLLAEGYTFISNRCRVLDTDAFRARLMLRPVVCVLGEDAARMFYEPGRFTRRGAMPMTALMSLQDFGSVATLDGAEHRHRKEMFLSFLAPGKVPSLGDAFEGEWRARLAEWERAGEVQLFDEASEVLCRAVCRWAGIPLSDAEARARTRELVAMIEGSGSFGPRNWRGLALRERTERWARDVVERTRAGTLAAPEDSALHAVATHRGPDGERLDAKVAAVELLNVLRPTVAVAHYIAFVALALHRYPRVRERLAGDEYLEWFVQEVRRFYPFFPAVAGRALEAFEWRGHRFEPRDWVMLDLYGTNHDARIWGDPHEFRPERFREWNGSAFSLIPQGGGGHGEGHRCAGEWGTIELVKRATRLLAFGMTYEVPPQDLRVELTRMPARPASGFRMQGVRRAS